MQFLELVEEDAIEILMIAPYIFVFSLDSLHYCDIYRCESDSPA